MLVIGDCIYAFADIIQFVFLLTVILIVCIVQVDAIL